MKRYQFNRLDSTNAWALAHADMLSSDQLAVVIADEQTNGRGRMGRPWTSPPLCNIYATFFFVLPSYREINRLAQLLAYSAVQALRPFNLELNLKWPNDLMIRGKKLAGVLCETTPLLSKKIGVAAGIGLNVNATLTDLNAIDQPATSLFIELGKLQERQIILSDLIEVFSHHLARFRAEGFQPFEAALSELILLQRT